MKMHAIWRQSEVGVFPRVVPSSHQTSCNSPQGESVQHISSSVRPFDERSALQQSSSNRGNKAALSAPPPPPPPPGLD